MASFWNEVRRGLRSPMFALGVLSCLAIYYAGVGQLGWINIILYPNDTWINRHNLFMTEFNPFRSLLPFAAVLPYGAAAAEDWERRFTSSILARVSFTRYCNTRFLAAAFLGGLVLAVGVVVFLGVMAVFIPPFDDSMYREPYIEPLLQNSQWILYFIYYASLQFDLGALCASCACVTAVLTPRRGMIWLCPLLLFAMLEIVAGVTVVGLSGGQSAIVFTLPAQTPLAAYGVIAGILLGLTLVCYGLFRALLRRRLYQWL